jgi:hypothetical protein
MTSKPCQQCGKSLALWRASFHPLEWPHQGSEAAQAHYRVCLGIYRGES